MGKAHRVGRREGRKEVKTEKLNEKVIKSEKHKNYFSFFKF